MRVLGSNGITVVRDSHIEDAAFATYGEYIPFYFDSASSNMLVFSGNVIADSSNNSSTNFDTIIKHGVNLVATGNHIENYGGQTITYFADHSLNNGSSSEYISGTTIQGGGLTNISRNWAYTVPRGIGAHTNYANSYGNGFVTNSNNTVEWKVGNNVSALTADQNGVLTTVGNIELGHATDTTLSRVSSGKIAVEGVDVPTISSTNTLTNKRIPPRTGTTTSSGTPTINTDNVDFYSLTAQTVDITSFTTNLSGTPTDGQKLWISITGTAARAITWGASFEASTTALPATTVTTARLDVGFIWNAATGKWRCVGAC